MRPSASYFFELSLSLRCLCFVFLIPSILADHCVIFTSLFTPFSLLSSSPPHPFLYLLISAPGTGIWKSFGFFLKGLIHTRHILLDTDRCTMAWCCCSKMTTIMLWSWLLSYKNYGEINSGCQSCVGFCCSGMMMANKKSIVIPPPPHLLILYCVTYCMPDLSVRVCVCIALNNVCVWEWDWWRETERERLWKRLVNKTTSIPLLFSFSQSVNSELCSVKISILTSHFILVLKSSVVCAANKTIKHFSSFTIFLLCKNVCKKSYWRF